MGVGAGGLVSAGYAGTSGAVSAGYAGTASVSERSAVRAKRTKNSKNKKQKKALSYNPREISSQLARASKSRIASVVLVRAKSKLGVLQRQLASGQYNESEVRTAIAHADRMVECSRLKLRNLKEEEQLQVRNDRESGEGKRRKQQEVKRRVKQKEQAIKAKMALQETQRVLKDKMNRQELVRKRRMHRDDEMGKITEADMKYMQDQRKNSQNGDSAQYNGVVLELSGAMSEMSELKMTEKQIERQVEMEMGAAPAGADVSGATALSFSGMEPAASADIAAEPAVTVDVSV